MDKYVKQQENQGKFRRIKIVHKTELFGDR